MAQEVVKQTSVVKPVYTVRESILTILGLLLSFTIIVFVFHVSNLSALVPSVSYVKEQQVEYENKVEIKAQQLKNFALERINSVKLDKEQKLIVSWLSKQYKVSTSALKLIVNAAWSIGLQKDLDPRLLLAVAAIESRFNPLAESSVGAQGLMQVLTRVHKEKYAPFGGVHSAFDPVINLEVGAQILYDCAKKSKSIEGGLNCYVGGNTAGRYPTKVLGIYKNLIEVSQNIEQKMFVPLYSEISSVRYAKELGGQLISRQP